MLIFDVASRTGAILVLVLTGLFALSLIISYFLALVKKRYVPMGVVALADTALSTFAAVRAIYMVGFNENHILMLAGIVTSLLTAVILLKIRITAS